MSARGPRPVSIDVASAELTARKRDHLRIAAGEDVVHRRGAGFEALRLRHRALPERDLRDVALDTELLGARLRAPLMVSAMTGGTGEAATVNDRLARAAAEHGVAMTLGSGRALLDDPSLRDTYGPRDAAGRAAPRRGARRPGRARAARGGAAAAPRSRGRARA